MGTGGGKNSKGAATTEAKKKDRNSVGAAEVKEEPKEGMGAGASKGRRRLQGPSYVLSAALGGKEPSFRALSAVCGRDKRTLVDLFTSPLNPPRVTEFHK
jgi:hypothetical protein